MRSVSLSEAKNGLSDLVERASKGEVTVIARRGQKIAMLVPFGHRWNRTPQEVVQHIRESRKGARLPKGLSIRRLINGGRQV